MQAILHYIVYKMCILQYIYILGASLLYDIVVVCSHWEQGGLEFLSTCSQLIQKMELTAPLRNSSSKEIKFNEIEYLQREGRNIKRYIYIY